MTDAFPSILVGPSSKERKYDRQLRLWAASGQQALEEARILLVNSDGSLGSDRTGVSGVVGVEALKNLVLPGIGGFTIVDPTIVTEPDLGVNFFLEEESLGKSRAEETCRLLKELNPDVEGYFHSKPIAELIQDPGFLPQHKLVLVSGPVKRSSLYSLCTGASELGIPVIYTHSVGFYSAFSLQIPAKFPIVETHPDPETTQDLRLVNPWPELNEAAARISNLNSMDDHQHGHVPYVLLILHYLEEWKKVHDGKIPANYKEKTEFREMVRAGARTDNPEGGEENFDEAVRAVLKTLNPFSLRSSLREIFEMEDCKNLNQESNNFWVVASAVNSFYQKHGVLPLPGSLPDMKALSADYISLQNVYKAKARKDLEEIIEEVRHIESELSRPTSVSEKEIEIFCKNAAHIKVVLGRQIPQIDEDAFTLKAVRKGLNISDSLIPIFIAFQVLDAVVNKVQESQEADVSLHDESTWEFQTDHVISLIARDDPDSINEETRERILQAIQELRRTDGGELHNISALTGGMVAQEAVKVITRQYIPLDNTSIFDGVQSRSEMYKL